MIPLYGDLPGDFNDWVESLLQAGFLVVLVQNNCGQKAELPFNLVRRVKQAESALHLLYNHNRGGVAGGFNRGVEHTIREGAEWVTLLDQDSRLVPSSLKRLVEPWLHCKTGLLVGPVIWDGRRGRGHGKAPTTTINSCFVTRLLISSGTTMRTADWAQLGPMFEWLVVDFVDHSWCFRAQARGFRLLQHPDVKLLQHFGKKHPNPICRFLGMELYSPMRHFYQLRNLRWLLFQAEVPMDLRCKELIKMLLKPWLWVLFEDKRAENLRAILMALQAPLPVPSAW